MRGTLSTPHPWGPWPGGDPVEFARGDVVAVGKLARYNDARTHLMVELSDGRRAFVRACDQEAVDAKWLLRPNQSLWTPAPRGVPCAERWRRLDQMLGRVDEDVGPWRSRDSAMFGRSEVVRVGRRRPRPGVRAKLLVELHDGRRVLLELHEQPEAECAWLAAHTPDLLPGELERWVAVRGESAPPAGAQLDAPVVSSTGERVDLSQSIVELGLSMRTENCLANAGIKTIGDLTRQTRLEICRIEQFGRKTLLEIEEGLAEFGLSLSPPACGACGRPLRSTDGSWTWTCPDHGVQLWGRVWGGGA